jgi:isoquinoline 1-oxidoreductase beta subunit
MTAAVSRRALLQSAAAALVVGWGPGRASPAVIAPGELATAQLNAWIRIDTDDRVTLTTHRAEMGQGAYTAVPQLLAEELEVPIDTVRVVFAPADPERYGSQVTGGSSTVRSGWRPLLEAGAMARDRLVRAAARRWQVPVGDCRAHKGQVWHDGSARRLRYGQLVAEAASLPPSAPPALKPRSQWHTAGRPVTRLDLAAKVDGRATFGIDVRLPGQHYAVVERSPRFEGRLVDFDATEALRVPGVTHVLRVERDLFGHVREGVAVVATSSWAAMQGRRVLHVRWDDGGFVHDDDASLQRRRDEALDGPVLDSHRQGDPAGAFVAAGADDVVVEARYDTPYQAHACLEPVNCTARVTPERVEVWGPIQAPEWVRDHLATRLGRHRREVSVQMTFIGGTFGRKASDDYALEAVQLAAATGHPVQVLWTREDDLGIGPFRPAMAYRCRAVLREGRVRALDLVAAGQNIGHQAPGADRRQPNESIREGLPAPWLAAVPHVRIGDAPIRSAVPVMWWRAVYASTNAFAFECFVDELAAAAGADPLAWRRSHFDAAGAARHVRLVDELVRFSGWSSRHRAALPRGWGASVVEAFDSLVGQVVSVARGDEGRVRIERIWVVIDCGWVVNPDTVRAQVEGSVVMALGAAVHHRVRFAEGRAVARDFAAYPLPTLPDIPPIEILILDRGDDAGGAGEPALPGTAPALANALADLTGRRQRTLPLSLA